MGEYYVDEAGNRFSLASNVKTLDDDSRPSVVAHPFNVTESGPDTR